MGAAGTYLFIPFILLVIGFFVFLFYPVVKSDAEMSKRMRKSAKPPAQPTHVKTDDEV